MSMPSERPALHPGASSLDARLCAEIGAELARARESRGLTEVEVGERLLLSVRQVKALETVDVAAFHNTTFHLKALRKYATFAALDPSLLHSLEAAAARPDPGPLAEPIGRRPPGGHARRLGPALAGLLAVAALAAGGDVLRVRAASLIAWAQGLKPRSAPSPADAAAPSRLASHPMNPALLPLAEPRAAAALAPDLAAHFDDAAAFGSVRVARSTWIFVRDADNVVIERSLRAGEALELESQPMYLAIGHPDAELRIGSSPIDLSRFVVNGQVRLRAGDFDALVQGATPIPAPTLATRP